MPRQLNVPVDLQWEKNVVTAVSPSFLIGSSSDLQKTSTGIKYQTSSILGQMGLFLLELLAFE